MPKSEVLWSSQAQIKCLPACLPIPPPTLLSIYAVCWLMYEHVQTVQTWVCAFGHAEMLGNRTLWQTKAFTQWFGNDVGPWNTHGLGCWLCSYVLGKGMLLLEDCALKISEACYLCPAWLSATLQVKHEEERFKSLSGARQHFHNQNQIIWIRLAAMPLPVRPTGAVAWAGFAET